MLAEDQDQPLVPLPLQGQHLLADFVLVQRAADRFAVRAAERAILAIVRAIVADVQRREQHDAVAVDVAFQLPGGVENLLDQLRLVGRQQHGRFVDRKRLLGHALGDNFAHFGRRPPWRSNRPCKRILVDEVESAAAEFVLVQHKRHQSLRSGRRAMAANLTVARLGSTGTSVLRLATFFRTGNFNPLCY